MRHSDLLSQLAQGSLLVNANLSNWYPVELKYRQYAGTARLEFEWSAVDVTSLVTVKPNTIIPSANLYQSYSLQGFPGPLVNNPARVCASNSEAFGAGLTLAKICSFASFTITARDSFSNPLTADQADWYVRLTNGPNIDYANVPDAFTYPGSTEWARNSRYIASYVAQGTGNWNFVSLLEGPGISATYYDSPDLNATSATTSLLQEVPFHFPRMCACFLLCVCACVGVGIGVRARIFVVGGSCW
jgi:hypothetical protein